MTAFKIFKRTQPLILRTIGVKGGGADAVLFETARQFIGAVLVREKTSTMLRLRSRSNCNIRSTLDWCGIS